MAIEEQSQPLSRFESAFIEHYISCWNAAESYRQAGGKSNRPEQRGYQILKRDAIKARVDARLKELSMEANEALERLAEQARLNPAQFFFFGWEPVMKAGKPLVDATGQPVMEYVKTGINWKAVQERGHLIKGIEYNQRGQVILKFHDSQRALELIGKNLKLFSEVIDINALGLNIKAYVGVSPEDWDGPAHSQEEPNTEYGNPEP